MLYQLSHPSPVGMVEGLNGATFTQLDYNAVLFDYAASATLCCPVPLHYNILLSHLFILQHMSVYTTTSVSLHYNTCPFTLQHLSLYTKTPVSLHYILLSHPFTLQHRLYPMMLFHTMTHRGSNDSLGDVPGHSAQIQAQHVVSIHADALAQHLQAERNGQRGKKT